MTNGPKSRVLVFPGRADRYTTKDREKTDNPLSVRSTGLTTNRCHDAKKIYPDPGRAPWRYSFGERTRAICIRGGRLWRERACSTGILDPFRLRWLSVRCLHALPVLGNRVIDECCGVIGGTWKDVREYLRYEP